MVHGAADRAAPDTNEMTHTHHARARLAIGLALACAGLAGCSDDSPRSIDRTRIARESDPPVIPGVTPQQRFRWAPSAEEAERAQLAPPAPPAVPKLGSTLPEGWEELPPTTFRHINTRVAGAPNAECYLTFLPGDGGGDLANVNRWRREMGLAPVDAAALAALPRTSLLGQPAIRIDLTGSFTGVTGQRIEVARLLGVLLTRQNTPGALFVKFVGPTDVVADNVDAFDRFVASIVFEEALGPSFSWRVPDGWTVDPVARSMREVTLTKGSAELYVSVLGGGGGGLLANVNRWLGQFGAPRIDATALAGLERVPCLGSEAYVIDAEGSFTGTDGNQQTGMGLLGALLEQPTRLVTVKLVGPAAEVRVERAAFLSFVSSLAEAP
jgi:hypothetical protein